MADPRPATPAPAGDTAKIGWIEKLDGTVTVHHADGRTAALHKGDAVYQNDDVRTENGGRIGVVFVDHSTFLLDSNGRMVLDEMVYDPNGSGSGNKSVISVVQGAFSLASGAIAHQHPDAQEIHTPLMTVGIRGTTVAGVVGTDGSLKVGLLTDADGRVGEIHLLGSNGSSATISSSGIGLEHYTGGPLVPEPVDTHYLSTLSGALPSGSAAPPPGFEPEPPLVPPNAEPEMHGALPGLLDGDHPSLASLPGDPFVFHTDSPAPVGPPDIVHNGPNVYPISVLPPTTETTSPTTPTSDHGRVIDGPISGATVFRDTNGDGILDNGEQSAVTKSDGTFNMLGGIGNLVVVNDGTGTDTTTGQPETMPLSTAAGWAMITPLTTLAVQLGGTPTAEGEVAAMLGLPADLDLGNFDPIAALSSTDPAIRAEGVQVLTAGTQAATMVYAVEEALNGVFGASTFSAVNAFAGLTDWANTAIGSSTAMDFTNATEVAAMLTDVAAAQGQSLDPTIAANLGQVIATLEGELATAMANDGPESAQVQTLLTDILSSTGPTQAAIALVAGGLDLSDASQVATNIGVLEDGHITSFTLTHGTGTVTAAEAADAIFSDDGGTITVQDSSANIIAYGSQFNGVTGLAVTDAVNLTDTFFANFHAYTITLTDGSASQGVVLGTNAEAAGIDLVDTEATGGGTTVDASAYDAAHQITIDAGTNLGDTLLGGAANDTFEVSASALSSDTIDGGSGFDTLVLSGSGTVADSDFANVSHIGDLALDATFNGGVTLGADAMTAGTSEVDGSATTGALTIDASAYGDPLTLLGGSGSDTFMLDASHLAGDSIHGGTGGTVLEITGSGPVNDTAFAHMTHIGTVELASSFSNNVTLGADAMAAGITDVDASATTGAIGIDASAFTGPLTLLGGSGGDEFALSASQLGNDSIDGGSGTATMVLSGSGTVADSAFAHVSHIGDLAFDASFSGGVTLGADAVAAGLTEVDGSATTGSFTIDASAYTNPLTLLGGSGSDTFTLDASQLAGDTIHGGTGGTILEVTGTSGITDPDFAHMTNIGTLEFASSLDHTLTLGADAMAAGITDVDASANTGAVTIFASTYTDPITLLGGSGDDIFLINAGQLANDHIDGGSGANSMGLIGSGSFTDSDFAHVTNIATLTLNNVLNNGEITLGTHAMAAGIVQVNANSGNTDGTIDASAYTIGISINDASSGATLLSGSGNDTFTIAATLLAGDSINGGGGSNTLDLTNASLSLSDSDFAHVSNIQTLELGETTSVTLGADAMAAGVDVVVGSQYIDASAMSGNDTLIGYVNGGNTIIVGASALGGDSINGEAGGILHLAGAGTVDDSAFAHVSGINELVLDASFSGALTLGVDAQTAGITEVLVGGDQLAGDTIAGGGGIDVLHLTGTGADSVGDNAFANMTGIDTLILDSSFGGSMTLGTDAATAGIGEIDASAITGNLTIDASGDSHNLAIIAGSGTETLLGGAGNDSFSLAGSHLGSDSIDGGGGANTLFLSGPAAVADSDFAHVSNIADVVLAGSFSGGVTLGADALAAGVTEVDGSVTAGSLTIDASAYAGPLTLLGGSGTDLFIVDASQLGFDTIHGDVAGAMLGVSGSGPVTDTDFANMTHITTVELVATFADTISLGTDAMAAGVGDVDGSVTTGGVTFDAMAFADPLTLLGGSGTDSFVVDFAQIGFDSISGGGGINSLSILDGGSLTDADFAHVSDIQTLDLGYSTSVTLGADAMAAGIDVVNGSQYIDASAMSGNDTLTGSEYGGNMIIVGVAQLAGDTLSSGDVTGQVVYGDSTLELTGTGTVGDSAFANVTDFQVLQLSSAFSDTLTLGTDAQTAGFTTVDASATTGALTIDVSGDTAITSIAAGSGADTIVLNAAGTSNITNYAPASDALQLDNSQFSLGSSGTLAAAQLDKANSSQQMGASGADYGGTGAGIIVIDDGSGGSNVWYSTQINNASTANSHEIAHLNVDTSAIDHTAFHLAV